MDLASTLYEEKKWDGVLYFTDCALQIASRPRTYICEAASWGSLPHDLRAMAFFYTGRYEEALEEEKKALGVEPENQRFLKNIEIMGKKVAASLR